MESTRKLRVWDLPTRMFHWALVLLIIVSFVSVKAGDDYLDWHFRSGYAVLTLLLFRLVWGFLGGYHTRFTSFFPRPKQVLQYLGGAFKRGASADPGHNPLGAVSVLALLLAFLFQVASGLFANRDGIDVGPLANRIGMDASDMITELHEGNQVILLALVFLHLAAIAFYWFYKRNNLVKPMITGDLVVPIDASFEVSRDTWATRLLALVVLAVCSGLVYAVVKFAG